MRHFIVFTTPDATPDHKMAIVRFIKNINANQVVLCCDSKAVGERGERIWKGLHASASHVVTNNYNQMMEGIKILLRERLKYQEKNKHLKLPMPNTLLIMMLFDCLLQKDIEHAIMRSKQANITFLFIEDKKQIGNSRLSPYIRANCAIFNASKLEINDL